MAWILHCCGCGVGRQLTGLLAWEHPYAADAAPKKNSNTMMFKWKGEKMNSIETWKLLALPLKRHLRSSRHGSVVSESD